MTPHRPIITDECPHTRFVGEAAVRKPRDGSLGWLVRMELVIVLSALLWSAVIGLVRLIA